jgi:hypothetical protein
MFSRTWGDRRNMTPPFSMQPVVKPVQTIMSSRSRAMQCYIHYLCSNVLQFEGIKSELKLISISSYKWGSTHHRKQVSVRQKTVMLWTSLLPGYAQFWQPGLRLWMKVFQVFQLKCDFWRKPRKTSNESVKTRVCQIKIPMELALQIFPKFAFGWES